MNFFRRRKNSIPFINHDSEEEGLANLCEDFFEGQSEEHEGLYKLFEDPDEKKKMIQKSIAKSRQRKRRRLNSGSCNQSKKSNSCQRMSSDDNLQNKDLLKIFDKKMKFQQPTLEHIQHLLASENLFTKVINAFEQSKKDIRMEDPIRILTRFAFNFVQYLFDD